MSIRNLTLLFIVLNFLGCKEASDSIENKRVDTTLKIQNKDANQTQPVFKVNGIDYILFGIYCGECGKHCASMYKLNIADSSMTLFADYTDSYFKDGNVTCKTAIWNQIMVALASSVINKIPYQLLTTQKVSERFGCPDCTDGCGIYFELSRKGRKKQFYIDTDTIKVPNDIRLFSEYLEEVIDQIKKEEHPNDGQASPPIISPLSHVK